MFGNLLTAMITPFDREGIISTDVVTRLSKKLYADGNDGIVLAGTTGESPNLSIEDRNILYTSVLNEVGDKSKIISGTGTYSTDETILLSKHAKDLGVHGLMLVTPYYSKPSQEGIYQHFVKVSEEVDLPIIAYNIPGRSSVLIEIDTLERIIKNSNVVAIKDAVNDLSYSKDEIDILGEIVEVYSGDDSLTLDMMKYGAKGVISVASHVVSSEIKTMITSFINGEYDKAESINSELNHIYDLLFQEPSPAPIKALLNDSFEFVGSCKLPLVDASNDLKNKLIQELSRIKNLKL